MEGKSSMSRRVVCPYCQGRAQLVSSKEVYNGRDYGPIYLCRPCDAWVGCHKGMTKPLGRLANAELRKWKIAAHDAFDPIWRRRWIRKHSEDPKYKKGMARGGRYKKLAELMGIPRAECHIGMFDVEQCRLTVEICQSGALKN